MARRVVRTPTKVVVDLDARKATILKAVVVEHIDTAQPVGSSAVAASADL
jgi:transcriptional regulator of heat shock response